MNASIVDLRYRMKEVLRAIDRGETVTVLHRGTPKAVLMPISPASDKSMPKTADQPLFGMWNDREDLTDPASWLRNLRQPRAVPGEAGAGSKRTAGKRK